MPTVVDSLVIKLGLDTVQFSQQQQRAITGLNQTMTTLKKTEETGRRTAMQMSSQGNVAAEYLSKMKTQALGLMSVLIGGKGLESVVRNSVTSLASLGRAATNIGVSVPNLNAFRNTIEANGGSADAAAASFQNLANQMEELRLHGDAAIRQGLQMLPGGVRAGESPMDVYRRFIDFAESHKGDVQLVRNVGMRLGLDEGSINTAMRGRAAFEKDLADAQKRSAPTPEMIQNMTALQRAWFELSQTAKGLADIFVDTLAPAMTAVLNLVNGLATTALPAIRSFVKEHPDAAKALGVGAVAVGSLAAFFGGGMLLRGVLGGLLGRGAGGALAGAAAGVAGGAGLVGAAAALTGAAGALTAAAAALGGGGVAGAAGNALGAVAGGRAGRLATSAAPSLLGRLGRTALRWAGPAAAAAGLILDSTSTQTDQHERTEGMRGGANAPQPGLPGTGDEQAAFRSSLSKIESGGKYNIMGGSSGRFAGKYQMGAAEIAETARALGESVPSQQQFLNDPAMQERFFNQYTLSHHNYLMRNPKYAAMSPAQKLAALGYAHNQGAGGANRWINTGQVGSDAFNTPGTRYSDSILNDISRLHAQTNTARGQQLAMNDNGGGRGGQTVHVNGPIVIHSQATDPPGIARGIRGALADQANTGLA